MYLEVYTLVIASLATCLIDFIVQKIRIYWFKILERYFENDFKETHKNSSKEKFFFF